jgi:hypothetical protein
MDKTTESLESLPPQLFGFTVDKISKEVDDNTVSLVPDICAAIDNIRKANQNVKPIVRIVFDFDADDEKYNGKKYDFDKEDFKAEAEEYKAAIDEISKRAFIMGEIVDSSAVYSCHFDPDLTHTYLERTKAYAEVLGSSVDIWEIGNEINGEWTGWKKEDWRDPNVTIEDMEAVRERVKLELKASLDALKEILPTAKTAFTFYFNDDDAGKISYTDDPKRSEKTGKLEQYGPEYSMMKWAKDCKSIFAGADYIFISYYQDDNYFNDEQIVPDFYRWASIFQKLNGYYPNACLGFGEVGAQCYYETNDTSPCTTRQNLGTACHSENDIYRGCPCCIKAQPEYITRYYDTWHHGIPAALGPLANKYVGGYFYWYFSDDIVDQNNTDTVTAFRTALAKF